MSDDPNDQLPRAAPLVVVALGIAVALGALGSGLPAHHWWARIALVGYSATAIAASTGHLRRYWAHLAIVACGLVPLAVLVVGRSRGWHHVAQSEVDVIEAGARRLVQHLTPYRDPADMSTAQAATHYSYFPYLPAMAIPGLPRAIFGAHWLTDARCVMAALDIVALRVAWPRLTRRSRHALLAVAASPLVTLELAAGGHDLLVTTSLVAGYAGLAAALGTASSFTVLGWPLALPGLFVGTERRRTLLLTAAIVATTALPVVVDPTASWANIVDFPAGRTPAPSPADAPSLGRLLRGLPGGELWVVALLAVIGVVLVVGLLWFPPRSNAAAAARAAVAFAALIVAVPSSRAGYLVHPVTLAALAWGERGRIRPVSHARSG